MHDQSQEIDQLIKVFKNDLAQLPKEVPTNLVQKRAILILVQKLEEAEKIIDSKLLDFGVANDLAVDKNAKLLDKIKEKGEVLWATPGVFSKLEEHRAGLVSLSEREKSLQNSMAAFNTLKLQLVNYKILHKIITPNDNKKPLNARCNTTTKVETEIGKDAIELLPVFKGKSVYGVETLDEPNEKGVETKIPLHEEPLIAKSFTSEKIENHGVNNRRIRVQPIIIQERVMWLLLTILVTVINISIYFWYTRN